MPISLEEWQNRVDKHFTKLSRTRADSGLPIFALEHDLTEAELTEVCDSLRERLSLGLRLEPHWLLWVIYATELGYDYDGNEYWFSFEERTPRWRDRGSRAHIRRWFSKFSLMYHGVKPTGPWAEWFSIIAWPITHAILPKYLQWQLAKALYDLRYRLVQLRDPSPGAVGQVLAANAWETSSRFQEFLQQQELVGRIALALIGSTKVAHHESIQHATLQRLVSDLERVQSAREWLKETRHYVADRLVGTQHASGRSLSVGEVEDESESELPPRIRPSLILKPSGPMSWSVVAEIPSFNLVARLNPELRSFLLKTRCRISGASDAWLPKAWLISGTPRRVLKCWPGMVPLVAFERRNDLVEKLISTECRLSHGPAWLFRVGSDGLGREIVGKIVRPGKKYVLLTVAEIPLGHALIQNCEVDCTGVRGALLSTPHAFSLEEIEFLEGLGLQVARTVRIWPAGLAGRGWDGEGNCEWLTTEHPCFGIAHDHEVDSYLLRLDNEAEIAIKAPPLGEAAFVSLSVLNVGRHILSVKTQGTDAVAATPSAAAEGVITLVVREPEPWLPGTTLHAGMFVSVDPPEPSLDLFWQGEVAINILGPPGHVVTCSIALLTPKGTGLLAETIGRFELPVSAEAWERKFARFTNSDKHELAYLEASSAKFVISDEELGEYALRLERDLKPLRWVCRSINRSTTARLIDDTGLEESPACGFFSFHHPTEPTAVGTNSAFSGMTIPTPGGLYEARHATFHDAIVVSTPQIEGGLQGLIIEPDLSNIGTETINVSTILELLHLWIHARIFGPLVSIRRRRIVERILNRLYARLCGSRWARAETLFLSNPQSDTALKQLEHAIGGMPGFGVILRRDYTKVEGGSPAGIQWFTDVAARYQICTDRGLSEFALQLACEPHRLVSIPKNVLDRLFTEIKPKTILLRGARFLALLWAADCPGAAGTALPKWKS
jgi:hypothetical protein